MLITHPIYGLGIVIQAAQGTFSHVQFTRDTNLPSSLPNKANCLAVSLRVCARG